MSPVTPHTPDWAPDLEAIKVEVSGIILEAAKNPISEKRFIELEDQYHVLKDQLLDGADLAEFIRQAEILEAELLCSTALVGTMVEFREMLEQIDAIARFAPGEMEALIAHEEAHADDANEAGYEWIGYGLIFRKDASGEMHMQAACFIKPNAEWGLEDMLLKDIKLSEAPMYKGQELSVGDIIKAQKDKQRLAKFRGEDEE